MHWRGVRINENAIGEVLDATTVTQHAHRGGLTPQWSHPNTVGELSDPA